LVVTTIQETVLVKFLPMIRVMDVTGSLKINQKTNSNVMHLERLQNGIYFVQFISEQNEIVIKRIIKH